MAHTYKVTARYRSAASGLGWSISTYISKTDQNAAFTEFDGWNDWYMGLCNSNTKFEDVSISDVLIWGDDYHVGPAGVTNTQGLLATKACPDAECILLTGRSTTIGNVGRSAWRLHGFDVSVLKADGTLNVLDAHVTGLVAVSGSFLQQYRKNPTPVHHLPAVDPPVPYTTYEASGPYVRRLGTSFFLPGQHARYRRTPA